MSFKGTLVTARQWAPFLALAHDDGMRGWLTDLLLEYIARDPLPHRPNGANPVHGNDDPKTTNSSPNPDISFWTFHTEIAIRNP